MHYGDTTLTFLSNLQKADDRGAGTDLHQRGHRRGEVGLGLQPGQPDRRPGDARQARASRARRSSRSTRRRARCCRDNPYVVLTADWVDEQASAPRPPTSSPTSSEPAQQKRFPRRRSARSKASRARAITEANGLLPDEPKIAVIDPPAPPVLRPGARRRGTQLRKRARVLLVIDVSGSMGDAVAGSGETKLDLAKQAARPALTQFAPDDEIGAVDLLAPQPDGAERPYTELVPIAPVRTNLGDAQAGRIAGAVARRRHRRSTPPPARRTSRCRRSLRPDPDQRGRRADRRQATSSRRTTTSTRWSTTLVGEDAEPSVRVFPIAYGDDADLGVLRRSRRRPAAAAYDATDPASHRQRSSPPWCPTSEPRRIPTSRGPDRARSCSTRGAGSSPAIAGGLVWAVGRPVGAVALPPSGSASRAAVYGVKVGAGVLVRRAAATRTRRPGADLPLRRRGAARPTCGCAGRSGRSGRWHEQTGRPATGRPRTHVGDVGDEAGETLDDLRRLAGQVTAVEAALRPGRRQPARAPSGSRLQHAVAAAADRAAAGGAAPRRWRRDEQLAGADRLAAPGDTLLARMQAHGARAGGPGGAARRGAGAGRHRRRRRHRRASASPTLAAELDGLRAGLAETEAVSRRVLGGQAAYAAARSRPDMIEHLTRQTVRGAPPTGGATDDGEPVRQGLEVPDGAASAPRSTSTPTRRSRSSRRSRRRSASTRRWSSRPRR